MSFYNPLIVISVYQNFLRFPDSRKQTLFELVDDVQKRHKTYSLLKWKLSL